MASKIRAPKKKKFFSPLLGRGIKGLGEGWGRVGRMGRWCFFKFFWGSLSTLFFFCATPRVIVCNVDGKGRRKKSHLEIKSPGALQQLLLYATKKKDPPILST